MGLETIAGQFPSQNVNANINSSGQPSAWTNYTTLGTQPWIVNQNTGTPPAAYPYQVTLNHGVISELLATTGYGFNIPSIATIVKVSITYSTYSANSNIDDYAAYLAYNGATMGSNASSGASWLNGAFTYTFPVAALTPAIVNSATFGCAVGAVNNNSVGSVTIGVTSASIAIAYTVPGLSNVVFQDTSVGWSVSQWSNGGQNVQALTAQPALVQPWQITGYSIGFQGVLCAPAGPNVQSFGQLGEIWGGLLFGSAPTPIGSSPWQNPMSQFPADSQLVSKLWDGTSDTTFPWYDLTQTQPPAAKFLTYPQSLSSPVAMQSGEQLSVGLWVTPSLVSNAQIVLANATYSVTYTTGSAT